MDQSISQQIQMLLLTFLNLRNNEGSNLDDSNVSNSMALINNDNGESITYSFTTNDQSFTLNPENDLPEFSNMVVILSNYKIRMATCLLMIPS